MEDRASNLQQRFLREHDRPFGNGVEVAVETESAEDVEERRLEQRFATTSRETFEVFEIRRTESEVLDVIDHRAQA